MTGTVNFTALKSRQTADRRRSVGERVWAWLLPLAFLALFSFLSPDRSEARDRCGQLSVKGISYRVDLIQGEMSCSRARRVIRFVLTHGHPTQGAPGAAPRGWSCGYGYGYRHGHRTQVARAGPLCRSGDIEVQGTAHGYTPLNRSLPPARTSIQPEGGYGSYYSHPQQFRWHSAGISGEATDVSWRKWDRADLWAPDTRLSARRWPATARQPG
jgi:hypothetical protein